MTPFAAVRAPSIVAESIGRARALYALAVPLGLACWAAFSWKGSLSAPALGFVALTFAVGATLDARSARRVRRWVTFSREVAEPGKDASRTVDLGVGDGFRLFGRDGSHPYRGADGVYLVGDADAALRRLRRRAAALGGLALLALGAAIAAGSFFLRERATTSPLALQPPLRSGWHPAISPALYDVDGDGVEDVIGVRRVGTGLPSDNDDYVISATSGKTIDALWSSQPFRRPPDQIILAAGKLFVRDGAHVTVWNPLDGSQGRQVALHNPRAGWATERGAFFEVQRSELGNGHPGMGAVVVPSGQAFLDLPRYGPIDDLCFKGKTEPCTPRMFASDLKPMGLGIGAILRRHEDDAVALQPDAKNPDEDEVVGFDPKTLEVRWRDRVPRDHDTVGPSTTPELVDGRVFTTFTSKLFFVRAQNAKTGAALWQTPMDVDGSDVPRLIASRARVYVVLSDRLEILDAATGDKIGTIR
jgi:hypothetical protein